MGALSGLSLIHIFDTVNPIVEGGTGFIPGPFGTGKTVLQHAISKQAEADMPLFFGIAA